jgi:hypothetical protein
LSKNSADHIINALKKYYTITVDNNAAKYIGLTIKWDYKNGKSPHVHARIFSKGNDKIQA